MYVGGGKECEVGFMASGLQNLFSGVLFNFAQTENVVPMQCKLIIVSF
jgi:hypothetical protein